jgi:PadR family transcriptional regulator, regulatory protein PadR
MPELKTLNRELKRGTLDMILLKLLADRPMYGYELGSTLANRGGKAFQIKEGTLYPVLYRLENDGLIDSQWETLERGVPRKYYHLTPVGKDQLEVLIDEWQEFFRSVNRLIETEEDNP